ncbi:ATP-binding protein [Streptomyces sp. PTD5-9]|uniref:ATP-binding protein n=1 Tax=Streptomyces sp. PTD5-9 TaxID=3120150 RepID=UPI00300910F9
MRADPTPYDPEAPQHPRPIAFTEPWSYELAFPCDPRSPRVARTALRAVLGAHRLDELSYRAELLTSELTTNSVRHTRGPASVRFQWRHPVLRVSVWDMSPDLPKPYAPSVGTGTGLGTDAGAEAGRGMAILELVADRWGGCAIGEGAFGPGGKTVWFELALGV